MNCIKRKIRKIIFRSLSKELANQAYLAILGREGDPQGLAHLAAQIGEERSIKNSLCDLLESEERMKLEKDIYFDKHAHATANQAYLAILGREGDPQGLTSLTAQIREERSIKNSLCDLLKSEERMKLEKEIYFDQHAHEIANQIYLAVLGRKGDPRGLAHYAATIRGECSIESPLNSLLESQERMKLEKRKCELAALFSDRRIIFLHVEKTGGTSLREMLLDAYGEDSCYASYQDNLNNFSSRWLSKFSLIYGHYHYDRIEHLRCMNYKLVTFLREPVGRLISLYNFWRAHGEGHPSYEGILRYANEVTFDEFFRSEAAKASPPIWNHMTYVMMGFNQWSHWRNSLSTMDEPSKIDYINLEIEPLMVNRIKEFFYIGFQDDFKNCTNTFFKKIDLPKPAKIKKKHSIENLQQNDELFKSEIFLLSPSLKVQSTLHDFTVLDRILYENAFKIHGRPSHGLVD